MDLIEARTQRDNESVGAYSEDLNRLLTTAGLLGTKLAMRYFIRGLKPSIRVGVQIRGADNLDDAIEHAEDLESKGVHLMVPTMPTHKKMEDKGYKATIEIKAEEARGRQKQ